MPIKVASTNLVYFPVPKVACTSIKHALLNHNEDGRADRLDAARQTDKSLPHVHMVYPSTPLRRRHFLEYFGRRWFCVVREPVSRFLSAYGNRVVHHRDLDGCRPALDRAGLSAEPDLETFVAHLDGYCAASRTIRDHVRPMVDYLGHTPRRYDRVFGMSELVALPAYLAEAGAGDGIVLGHKQTGGPKLTRGDLSPGALKRVTDFYADDYSAFGAWFG